MSRPLYEQGLRAWVASILTPLSIEPTIYSDDGKPRRIPPYATILITASNQVGLPERRDSYDAGDDKLTNIIKTTQAGNVDVTVFGAGHATAAHALVASTWSQDTLDFLEGYGLSVSAGSPSAGIIRLSRLTAGVTETRSVISFAFSWAYVYSQQSDDWIETAVLTGDIN